MAAPSAPSARRAKAVESFKTAADCIGTIEPGHSLFAITRGQFSMIDAVLACLDQSGPSDVSLWTWTVAEYEIECLERLRNDGRVRSDSPMEIDVWRRLGALRSQSLENRHNQKRQIQTAAARVHEPQFQPEV